MNAQVQKTLESLETALQTLVDSVYTYNPSSAAARALVQAEEELTRELTLVAEHQALYHRLQSLNSLAQEIDDQTVSILKKLEECHLELTSLPPPPSPISSPPPETTNPLLHPAQDDKDKTPEYARPPVKVPYKELLDYAKKISKFTTAAPTKVVTDADMKKEKGGEEVKKEGEDGEKKAGKNWLTKEEVEGINAAERSGKNKFPWPEEDKMKSGALWFIQTGGKIKMEETQNGN